MPSPRNHLYFRWHGVAGIELTANNRTLAVDPFFTRPPFRHFPFGRVTPNRRLVRQMMPACDYVFVSHSHWDHLMDVPEVARNTGAVAFGSPNTCRLLALLGLPAEQIRLIRAGDRLVLEGFVVEVLPAEHGYAPPTLGPGPLVPNLHPPLRISDYRMDECFSFLVEVEGYRLLLLPGGASAPADLLFIVLSKLSRSYYASLLRDVQPAAVIPVHWDNIFRPLGAAVHEVGWPVTMMLSWFRKLVRRTTPAARYIVPKPARAYDVAQLASRKARARGDAPTSTL